MTKNKLSAKLDTFVEQVGEIFASAGHQRIAGRLFGWLLICDPPHQSAAEILEATGASKASVSTNLRLLQAAGLVKRIGVAGERRAYYQMNIEAWSKDLEGRVAEISAMRRVAESGLEALESAPVERRERLEAMRAFYTFFEKEMPMLLERWEQELESKR